MVLLALPGLPLRIQKFRADRLAPAGHRPKISAGRPPNYQNIGRPALEGTLSNTYKQKPQLILDYNRYKCGVDILDQLLKGHRPFRATRRWPCVLFFDLIGLSSRASYVLYTNKFVDSHIARKKQRREYLYMLGIELVLLQIVKRRESSNFRYLTKEVRSYIDDLFKSKCGSQDVSVVTPEITPVHCSSIPESSAVPTSTSVPSHLLLLSHMLFLCHFQLMSQFLLLNHLLLLSHMNALHLYHKLSFPVLQLSLDQTFKV